MPKKLGNYPTPPRWPTDVSLPPQANPHLPPRRTEAQSISLWMENDACISDNQLRYKARDTEATSTFGTNRTIIMGFLYHKATRLDENARFWCHFNITILRLIIFDEKSNSADQVTRLVFRQLVYTRPNIRLWCSCTSWSSTSFR